LIFLAGKEAEPEALNMRQVHPESTHRIRFPECCERGKLAHALARRVVDCVGDHCDQAEIEISPKPFYGLSEGPLVASVVEAVRSGCDGGDEVSVFH
jgi:hypothetical protein